MFLAHPIVDKDLGAPRIRSLGILVIHYMCGIRCCLFPYLSHVGSNDPEALAANCWTEGKLRPAHCRYGHSTDDISLLETLTQSSRVHRAYTCYRQFRDVIEQHAILCVPFYNN